jgi:hypothetical protein
MVLRIKGSMLVRTHSLPTVSVGALWFAPPFDRAFRV